MNLKVVFDATDAGGKLHQFLMNCMMDMYQKNETFIYGMMTVNIIHLIASEGTPQYLLLKNQPLYRESETVEIDLKIVGTNGEDLSDYYSNNTQLKPQSYPLTESILKAYSSDWISIANVGIQLKKQFYFISELVELHKQYYDQYLHRY